MALSPVEEAQTRQLIAQEAPLLTLAASEATIISKLGATKVNLSQLPAATTVADADLLLIRQGTTDKGVAASAFKTYAAAAAASETVAGIVRLATDAETQSGSLRTIAVDPAGLHTALSGLVGDMRNGKMLIAAASTTATYNADQIIVAESLGGAEYRLSAFSQAINLAATGAGGMDIGTAPVSGYVALYAIYNPLTAIKNILAVNATSAAAPNVYGGANMPAGYLASALISVWPTNASSQFKTGLQIDRSIGFSSINVLNTTTSAGVFTSLAISAIPFNARSISGWMNVSNGLSSSEDTNLVVASDANGSGGQKLDFSIGVAGGASCGCTFSGLLLATAQTMYYNATTTSSPATFTINLSSYTF